MKTEKNPLLNLLQSELNQHAAITASLKEENRSLKELVAILTLENTTLKNQVLVLTEQMEWFKRQIFGQRSEKEREMPGSDQQSNFFDLLGVLPETKEPIEEDPKPETKSRKKPNRNGQDAIKFPADIPVQKTFLDIPEEDKICKETGVPLVKIGEEITQTLAHKAGSFYIKEIIRPKYAHPRKEEAGILTADLPDSLLPKCSADESLLAEIVSKKFVDHLPLYRISEAMTRNGIHISRKLLSQWVLKCGSALIPLYDEMTRLVLLSGNIFIDESPVNVQALKKTKKGFMWVVVGGQESNPPYRVYSFKMDRCHHNVWDILGDYEGVMHSDKYEAYNKLAGKGLIKWCPCWAHIRRYFFEAEVGDPKFRKWVLRKIRYLYMLEKVAWARSPEERLKIRLEKEVPIIDELIVKIKEKLAEGRVLPKSKLSKALGYFCSLIPYLKTYTKYPFARLDNNVAERAIRPLAIGRKNWLFFGSEQGGKSAAVLLSLVQTCRGLGINPREYLEDVFRRIMSHSSKKLHELLPDQWLLHRQQNSVI